MSFKKSIEKIRATTADLRKSVVDIKEDFVMKGEHDAMFHHAIHARAAEVANGKDESHREKNKESAKKHRHMLMKHAVECVKNAEPYCMKGNLMDALNFYDQAASSHIPYGQKEGKKHKAVQHFEKGGEFVSTKEDAKV